MRLSAHNRQTIAIWLSAILLLLSFAASSHSLSHFDDGAPNHCTLCFHQDQLNKLLPTQAFLLPAQPLVLEPFQPAQAIFAFRHVSRFRSRAPPVSL